MRTLVILALGLFAPAGLGCGPKADSDSDGDGSGSGESGDDTGDDAGSADTGPSTFDGDCSLLPSDGPTVAGGDPTVLGFPERGCNPRQESLGSNTDYTCCSDDPAAGDGGLPNYQGKGIEGNTPIFSGLNNALGTSGMCVRTSDIPDGSGLLEPGVVNCPIPCNPTWSDDDILAVCGQARICCQTIELQPADCIQDEDGTWRAATGEDVLAGRSIWAPETHATHQDPNGIGCMQFAGNAAGSEFESCVGQLTVADQRGFCMSLGPGQICPSADPSYIDACEAMNQ